VVLGEEQHQIQVPDATLLSQVMVSTTLSEGGEAETMAPAAKVSVPAEEVVALGVGEPSQSGEVGLVDSLVRAGDVARHANWRRSLHRHLLPPKVRSSPTSSPMDESYEASRNVDH
jgi:hypothetical protein